MFKFIGGYPIRLKSETPEGVFFATVEREELELGLRDAFNFFCIGQSGLDADIHVTLDDERVRFTLKKLIGQKYNFSLDDVLIVGVDKVDLDEVDPLEFYSAWSRFPLCEDQAAICKALSVGTLDADSLTEEQFHAVYQRTRQEMAEGITLPGEHVNCNTENIDRFRKLFRENQPSLFQEQAQAFPI